MLRRFYCLPTTVLTVALAGCGDKGGDAPPADDGSSTAADDTAAPASWHPDSDGDGFGDPNQAATTVDSATSYVEDGSDCDDTDPAIHPGAEETCNQQDDDCDGNVDEGLPSFTWYADTDGDGFGDPASAEASCAAREGETADGSDCDDTDATIFPGAEEECGSEVDRNCDGAIARCPLWGDFKMADAGVAFWGPTEFQTASTVATGDLNGDLQHDLVVGAPGIPHPSVAGFSSGTGGEIYVQEGPIAGSAVLGETGGQVVETNGDRTFLGWSVGVTEDLDGDGMDELSAYRSVDGEDSVAIWMGPIEGTISADDWDARLIHNAMYYPFQNAGDQNYDGENDLVVGLGLDDLVGGGQGNSGKVAILAGPFSGTIDLDVETLGAVGMGSGSWSDSSSGLGFGIDAEDLNGDGIQDLCLGQSNTSQSWSSVYFVYGPISGDVLVGDGGEGEDGVLEADSAHLGYALQCVDLDGDGYPDLVSGAKDDQLRSWLGGVWIQYGPLTGVMSFDKVTDGIVLTDDDLSFRGFLDMRSDLDGDGVNDLALSTYQDDRTGRARIFYGPISGVSATVDADATMAGNAAGHDAWYLTTGDLDGDGLGDVVVGAAQDSTLATSAGAAYLFFGAPR